MNVRRYLAYIKLTLESALAQASEGQFSAMLFFEMVTILLRLLAPDLSVLGCLYCFDDSERLRVYAGGFYFSSHQSSTERLVSQGIPRLDFFP